MNWNVFIATMCMMSILFNILDNIVDNVDNICIYNITIFIIIMVISIVQVIIV